MQFLRNCIFLAKLKISLLLYEVHYPIFHLNHLLGKIIVAKEDN